MEIQDVIYYSKEAYVPNNVHIIGVKIPYSNHEQVLMDLISSIHVLRLSI